VERARRLAETHGIACAVLRAQPGRRPTPWVGRKRDRGGECMTYPRRGPTLCSCRLRDAATAGLTLGRVSLEADLEAKSTEATLAKLARRPAWD
jgi:hypothetical protein